MVTTKSAMERETGLQIFDCDSHVWEPQSIWDEYLDPAYRVLGRSAFSHRIDDEDGNASVIVNGCSAPSMNGSRINRQAIWHPGTTLDQIGGLNPAQAYSINPGAYDPSARLVDMDALGIKEALLFPTLFSEYLPVVDNPDVAHALARAYNDWIRDFCRAAPDRLIPAAVLPMQDVVLALAEAKRVARQGFKAISVRPCFFRGRFLNHLSYDALWRLLERLGLALFIHPSPGGTNPEWTSAGAFVDRVAANLHIGHAVAESVAPMMDNGTALNAFFYSGHFEDYPELRIAFVHGGASWVPLALEKIETYLVITSSIRDITLDPERVFLERPSLVGFDGWETVVSRMHDYFAAFAAWGSRYPHHDASSPGEAILRLERAGVPHETVDGLMGGNLRRFLTIPS